MNYIDLAKAKAVFQDGKNVTAFLREEFNEAENTSEIIEIAYDLQAGSYSEYVESNWNSANSFSREISEYLDRGMRDGDSLLDIGTGELTTLTLLMKNMQTQMSKVFAFDISWSRLYCGRKFFDRHYTGTTELVSFVADIKKIPLPNNSIDVITSCHALEPNGRHLTMLISELFRVAKRKLILFEPSYENASREAQDRMQRLGYIKDIEGVVKNLGGEVVSVNPIKNISNPLNPTFCFEIVPPSGENPENTEPTFTVPGSSKFLVPKDGFLRSSDTGLMFPIVDSIPILRAEKSILATRSFDEN